MLNKFIFLLLFPLTIYANSINELAVLDYTYIDTIPVEYSCSLKSGRYIEFKFIKHCKPEKLSITQDGSIMVTCDNLTTFNFEIK
jgi:hypothetical protein